MSGNLFRNHVDARQKELNHFQHTTPGTMVRFRIRYRLVWAAFSHALFSSQVRCSFRRSCLVSRMRRVRYGKLASGQESLQRPPGFVYSAQHAFPTLFPTSGAQRAAHHWH